MSWWWNSPLVYVQNNLQFRNNMLAISFIWRMEWRRSNIISWLIQLKDEKLISEYPIAEAFAVMTSLCLSSHMEMGFKKSITETDSVLSNHSVTCPGTSLPDVSDSTNTTHTILSRFWPSLCRKESSICQLVKTSLPLKRMDPLLTKRSLCVNHYLLWNLPPLY